MKKELHENWPENIVPYRFHNVKKYLITWD